MFDFAFYSQEQAYLNPPDETFDRDDRDYDLMFDERREREMLEEDF